MLMPAWCVNQNGRYGERGWDGCRYRSMILLHFASRYGLGDLFIVCDSLFHASCCESMWIKATYFESIWELREHDKGPP